MRCNRYSILFELNISSQSDDQTKLIKCRRLKDICIVKTDIQNSKLFAETLDNVDDMVTQYNQVLQAVLDKHAPLKDVKIRLKRNAPWYTGELKVAKTLRRKLERRWRTSHTLDDYVSFRKQCILVNKLLLSVKREWYRGKVDRAQSQKELFKITQELLNDKCKSHLPPHTSEIELAERFSHFFQTKIQKIREGIESNQFNVASNTSNTSKAVFKPTHLCLSQFQSVLLADVHKEIESMKPKSCSLDPFPTWLAKKCANELAPFLTRLVNMSLETGQVPQEFKRALVKPLLKEASVDSSDLKNFRPVSNLSFASKLLERVVCTQLNNFIKQNNLHNKFQSAYKSNHSTETALLRVQNDLCQAVDHSGAALLVLLDLSAAFDTLDHSVLSNRLDTVLGIKGKALSWIKSYLTDRYQSITINETVSSVSKLCYGVPQGSVLGPNLFNIYTTPLVSVIEKHNIKFHMYADDVQLYINFNPSSQMDTENAVSSMEACLQDIKMWMSENYLKLNSSKTEVIMLSTGYHLISIYYF